MDLDLILTTALDDCWVMFHVLRVEDQHFPVEIWLSSHFNNLLPFLFNTKFILGTLEDDRREVLMCDSLSIAFRFWLLNENVFVLTSDGDHWNALLSHVCCHAFPKWVPRDGWTSFCLNPSHECHQVYVFHSLSINFFLWDVVMIFITEMSWKNYNTQVCTYWYKKL